MKIKILGLLATGLLGATLANANLLRLDATAAADVNPSDFWVLFDDTGDGLLQAGEIISFSGMFVFGLDFFTRLETVPTIVGISSQSGEFCPSENRWCFSEPDDNLGHSAPPSAFNFAITVPEPGTLALFGLALLGPVVTRSRAH